jgi:hypothetical protein
VAALVGLGSVLVIGGAAALAVVARQRRRGTHTG